MMKTTIKTCTRCSAAYDPTTTHVCSARTVENFGRIPLPKAGMVLDKKYRLISKLGEGGMGSVFRARRMFIDDFVAIKFMRPEVVANEDIRQRFYHEARVAARMQHPNVVAVYDFGETAEGLAYLVMEFLEGQSLGELLHGQGPLELEQVLELGIQICEALTCMLENNVIHRDLKPDNIMLVPDNQSGWMVKVVDFGVAKILESDYQLTRVQARIGSPVYSSPEQYLGKYVDHRTDLYGLGVIFYECLTGHVPFEALTQNELLAAIVHKMPQRLDEKIDGFTTLMADLVQWLLAKDPNDRPHDATEVSRCLQTLRDGKKSLLLYEDKRRVETRKDANVPVKAVRSKEPSQSRNKNEAAPRKNVGSKSPRLSPGLANVTPIFRPRSVRRRIKRKIKSLARPLVFIFAATTAVVLGWWWWSGMPAIQDFAPVAAIYSFFPQKSAPLKTRMTVPAPTNARLDTAGTQQTAALMLPTNGRQVPFDSLSQKVVNKSTLATAARTSERIVPVRAETRKVVTNRNAAGMKPQPARRPANEIALPANMVFVKDSSYQRGDIFGDGASNERPVHWVRLNGFYISKFEVTNEEYLAFVTATKANLPEWMDPASKYYYQSGNDNFYKKLGAALYDPKHPVVGISWNDAKKYCEWLSQKGPWQYRLPTEAEWEAAARGGRSRLKYSWGEGAPQPGKGGNIADESLKEVLPNLSMIWRAYNDTYTYTAPVGKFGANAFGLYDMTGNVWEWCSDWFGTNEYEKRDGNNPMGPSNGTEKVIRGGSWSDTPDKLRLSYRRGVPPTFRSNNLGFRVVAVAPAAFVNNNPAQR
ncbi:SUMF1/EgtB/PvdO family nonheme iron enzyme [candidate division KSB1 bacterium]|nr:SUMF1/EgtB/PvdO family nonheme iron enzyme [candidate division KSB1 bacterium]